MASKNRKFALCEAISALAREGWCVVLKKMPPKMGWIIQGSRSEYDAPCPDREIGIDRWCAEATYVGPSDHWFRSQFTMDDSPYVAIRRLAEKCREAMSKRRVITT